MNQSRIKFDPATGLVEIEGDEKFVSENLDKILPLIQLRPARRVAAGPEAFREAEPYENLEAGGVEEQTRQEPNQPAKRQRRMPKRPPPGASCRDRILILRSERFFKDLRAPSEIVGGLARKGWTYQGNQVGASLTTMFEKGEIQRTKEGDGPFKYYWDRD